MEILFLIVIIIGLLFAYSSRKSNKIEIFRVPIIPPVVSRYTKKSSVMSKSESAFFFELQRQLPQDYYIFPKMRIADVLNIPNGHDYYKMRNKALPKHIDFLVCDKFFKPIVAIEINGASHNSFKQQEADQIKNEMFKDSGLPIETINVGSSFSESVKQLEHYFVYP